MIFSLSCNYNNYMTYNWPNSAFFNFQKNVNQENCRQYSCILFLVTNWNKKPDEERIYRWTEFFHNSPVKLWFSIKLIAIGFFSTSFNCWIAAWQHTKNPPKSGRWNMRKLAVKIFNSHHRKPNIRKITNSDKTSDNCVLFSQEFFDITSLVYFG